LRYNEFQHNGWEGSRVIVRSLVAANRVDPSIEHAWIAQALGVNRYCVWVEHMRMCRPPVITQQPVPAVVTTPPVQQTAQGLR
jgi:hypothetical protein